MKYKATILSDADVQRTLVRISHQIIEKNRGTQDLCLIGIRTRGVPLAQRIADNIGRIYGEKLPVGELDITPYRADLSEANKSPVLNGSNVPFSVAGNTVVLVEEVIFTTRTARAALGAVMSLGRPARIQLAVLIDRGHSELPIKPDYVGKNIPTSLEELISVKLTETDGQTNVAIYTK